MVPWARQTAIWPLCDSLAARSPTPWFFHCLNYVSIYMYIILSNAGVYIFLFYPTPPKVCIFSPQLTKNLQNSTKKPEHFIIFHYIKFHLGKI